jgi:hypothetical protein
MEVKWSKVITELALDPLFANSGIASRTWEAVQAQFNRFKEDVLEKAGISDDQLNLSALEEEPDEFTKLMLNMAEEVAAKKTDSKEKREKKEKKNKDMLAFEDKMLSGSASIQQQSKEEAQMALLRTPSASETSDPVCSTSSGSEKKRKESKSWTDGIESTLRVLLREEEEDTLLRKRAFEEDEKTAAHKRSMEERQLKLQEETLALQKEQHKQREQETQLLLALVQQLVNAKK